MTCIKFCFVKMRSMNVNTSIKVKLEMLNVSSGSVLAKSINVSSVTT